MVYMKTCQTHVTDTYTISVASYFNRIKKKKTLNKKSYFNRAKNFVVNNRY